VFTLYLAFFASYNLLPFYLAYTAFLIYFSFIFSFDSSPDLFPGWMS